MERKVGGQVELNSTEKAKWMMAEEAARKKEESKSKQEAELKAKQDLDEKSKKNAEEKARKEVEEKTKEVKLMLTSTPMQGAVNKKPFFDVDIENMEQKRPKFNSTAELEEEEMSKKVVDVKKTMALKAELEAEENSKGKDEEKAINKTKELKAKNLAADEAKIKDEVKIMKEMIEKARQAELKDKNAAQQKEGKKPLVCSRKSSGRKNVLEVVYKGEKSFKCAFCDKTFKQKGYMNKHISAVHEMRKKFVCSRKSSKFARKQDLERHNQVVHEDKRPFQCSHCKKTFGQKGNMNKHISDAHENKENVFKCK